MSTVTPEESGTSFGFQVWDALADLFRGYQDSTGADPDVTVPTWDALDELERMAFTLAALRISKGVLVELLLRFAVCKRCAGDGSIDIGPDPEYPWDRSRDACPDCAGTGWRQ